MPNLSADTLFHFTPREYLLDKFERGFMPRLLSEFDPEVDTGFFSSNVVIRENGKEVENADLRVLYIPMVCFCDIPVSSLKFHMEVYSEYGIGMKKDWGIKSGINPVMYVNTNSHFFSTLVSPLFMLEFMGSVIQRQLNDTESLKNIDALYEMTGSAASLFQNLLIIKDSIQCYLKPFKCSGVYRGKYSNYKYYDEKEWRYSPIYFRDGLPPIHGILTQDEIKQMNDILSNHPLKFTAEDIKYIILKEDSDIQYVKDGLIDIKNRTGRYTDEDIERLCSKILTSEQIRQNPALVNEEDY